MSSTAYVDRARGMARFLEDREAHLSGDREIARARLEQRYGIAGSIFYSLRYRPPKQIAVEIYERLCLAVEDAASQQVRALQNEIAAAQAGHRQIREDAIRKAEAALRDVTAAVHEASRP